MDLYAENILDHYRHPRGKQRLASPAVTHEEVNLSCGDNLTLDLTVHEDRVTAMGWNGSGCAISQAAMSLMTEELTGKSFAELLALRSPDILALLGVPVGPRRFKCALLGLHTLQNALRKLNGAEPQGWAELASKG